MIIPQPNTKNLDPRAQQIQNLKGLSRKYRDEFKGTRWQENARDLFEMTLAGSTSSTLRPIVRIPQFQQIALMEATDLSTIQPRVTIQSPKADQPQYTERDEEREKAFEDHWQWIMAGSAMFYATLWGMFAGEGWLSVAFDPLGDVGNGRLALCWEDPSDVFPDPFCKWQDLSQPPQTSFIILERMINEDVWRERFSAFGRGPGALVNALDVSQASSIPISGDSVNPPIRTLWGPGSPDYNPAMQGKPSSTSGMVPGHICYVRDYSEREPSDRLGTEIGDTGVTIPAGRFKYPYGRLIVEAGGKILFDGRNNWGGINGWTLFPTIPVYSMPPLTGPWAPPPFRLSLSLQRMAEQMWSQLAENFARTANCITYVPSESNIDTSNFGALPGEIVVYAGQKSPTHEWGSRMPSSSNQYADALLQMGQILQGYTAGRMGEASAGNVGAELFDAAIGEGRKLTRMRSLLMYPTLNTLCATLYGGMCRYYKQSMTFPSFNSDEVSEASTWKPGGLEGSCRLLPGSVKITSEASQQKFALQARQLGLISKQRTLEDIDYPRAREAAEEVEQEEKLAAVQGLRKR